MRTLMLFGILSGLCSANRDISIPGIPAHYLQSSQAQAAICKHYANFVIQVFKAYYLKRLSNL
jgi:hypothetical protein